MCGFVGVIGVESAAAAIAIGLQTIQHRGQDATGVATWDGRRFHLHKDLGLVTTALPVDVLERLHGSAGLGHVRYPTLGGSTREDAQPFLSRFPGVLLCHNGSITNQQELLDELLERGLHALSRSDSEAVLLVLADELTRLRPSHHSLEDLEHAFTRLMERVRGSYTAATLLTVDGRSTLVAFRDPHGIRPGVYGRRSDGAWCVASESVALDALGFRRVGNIPAGSVVILREGEEPIVLKVANAPARHCVFERIYFARADSMMEGGRVNSSRWALGERLADEVRAKGIQPDVVVAIPDTSRPAAMAISERLGIPNREGFIKNRYSGRTFIMPDATSREAALRLKLNPIPETFAGKKVLLLDDSIVRGTTMSRITRLVQTLGPAEIHLGIFSPPVRNPCFYGIDMPSRSELVAGDLSESAIEEELAAAFGVDSVTYLSVEGLEAVVGPGVCSACFTGDYPVPIAEKERSFILGQRRPSA